MLLFCLLCSQGPVEVPYSLGVNLAVEGAPLRPPRARRHAALTSLSHSDLPSQQLRKVHRISSLESCRVSDSCRSGKERRSKKKRGNKKRQPTSTCPETGQERSAGAHKTSSARGSLCCPVNGHPLVDSRGNPQTLSPSSSKAALVPLNLSFSLTPRHSAEQSRRTSGRRSRISGSIPLQAAVQHHNRMSAQLRPPLRLPLPALEVLPYHLM